MAKVSEHDFPLNGEDIAFLSPEKLAELRNFRLIGQVSDDIENMNPPSVAEKLRWQRRRVVAAISNSKRITDGMSAAQLVREASFVIRKGYMIPRAHLIAQQSHFDSLGNPYHLAAEMYRDYHYERQRVAQLTGEHSVYQSALRAINAAVRLAPPESGADLLARMERELLRKEMGEKLDHDKFSDAFEGIRRNFLHDVGSDRLAIAAYWYARESYEEGHLESGRKGIRALRDAIPDIPARFKFVLENMFKDAIKPVILDAQRRSAPKLRTVDFSIS